MSRSRERTKPTGTRRVRNGDPGFYGAEIIDFAEAINRGHSPIFDEDRTGSIRKLVIAAIESFAEKGYHATTTRDIARRAELSPAALYVHFRTKKDVLFKITNSIAAAMVEYLHEVGQNGSTPSVRLRNIVAAYVRCNAKLHTAVHIATFEFEALDPEQRKVIVELRDRVNSLFVDCLSAGKVTGEFQIPDLQIMRLAIMSLCISVSRWYSAEGKLTPEELGEVYGDIVLNMVKAKPRRSSQLRDAR